MSYRYRTWLVLIVVLLSAALILTGCGRRRATPTPQPTNTAVPPTNTVAPATNTPVPATATTAPATATTAPATATTAPATTAPTTAPTSAAVITPTVAATGTVTTTAAFTTTAAAIPAPIITHTLEGRAECAVCHGPTGPVPATPRHASLKFDNCLNCHMPEDAEAVIYQLVSAPAAEAPTLDGAGDDAAWEDATAVTIPVAGGANTAEMTVTVKSVYAEEMVYFLVTWNDPTDSNIRAPWEKQDDGSWIRLSDPEDRGGDNNLWYEDKLAFIWDIGNSIPDFPTAGCGVTCHFGEEPKPYGNKYTAEEGQMGDIWHWKSVRNLGQVDDQYLDHTRYSDTTREAGRKSDPRESGGYSNNETEDRTLPAFMLPEGGATDGTPGYILDDEKVEFDDDAFEAGDRVPGIIKSAFVGDRGDITAGWMHDGETWTLEFGRPLETGSEFDVQFDDLTATYYFGVAAFDNAQVRHSYQQGVTEFTFQAE